jgi:putative transposase
MIISSKSAWPLEETPYQSATAESFIKISKYEEVYLWNYQTLDDVIKRIPFFIREVYNKKRLHSALGYLPPDEFGDPLNEKEQTQTLSAITI